jgi:hypothetical protein
VYIIFLQPCANENEAVPFDWEGRPEKPKEEVVVGEDV